MKKIYFIVLTFLTLLTSCTEEINLKVAKGDPKIVIEGSIENGKYAEIMVTRNSALSDPVNFSSILVSNAKAWVTSGGITDTLRSTVDPFAAIPYTYTGNTILGVRGETYKLTVIADGRTFTSTTTIPLAEVTLDSVWWKAQAPHTTLGFAWAHLSEPAGMGNAYKWFAKRPLKHRLWAGSPIVVNRRFVSPSGGTFDDKYIDGKSFDFAYDKSYDPTEASIDFIEPKEERGFYKNIDTIYIKFCTIDNATSLFYNTYDQALQSNGNPFASPVTILSNISGDGALGIWAGFGATYDTIMPH